MKILIYLIYPLFALLQEHSYFIKCDDVQTRVKGNEISIISDHSLLDRQVLLIRNEKDTLYNHTKRGKFADDFKFIPQKDQLLELKVITFTRDGWSSKSKLYWSYTIYFD